jgi:hypothetical protein
MTHQHPTQPVAHNQSGRASILVNALLILFALNALLSIGRAVTRTINPDGGGIDLHVYWLAGHFIRQGDDPYLAYRQRQEPDLPVHYIDGATTETPPIAQPGLATLPAIMPPLVLLLAPSAFLSWPTAKLIWLICNLALMVAIPWLLVRLLPRPGLTASQTLLVALIFFGFSATRVAVWTGQTTLLVFFLMIVALLLHRRNSWLSGIALGFAMAKYSVALPAFLILLYRRSVRAWGISLLVQALALLALAWIAQRPPLAVLQTYLSLAARYLISPGIHLATIFPQQSRPLSYAILAVGLALLIGLAVWTLRARPTASTSAHANVTALIDFHLFAILSLWALLVAYHRIYDAAISIVFVALIVYGLSHRPVWSSLWKLSETGRRGVFALLALFVGVQTLPGEVMGRFLSPEQTEVWLRLVDQSITYSILLALALSIWLYLRLLLAQQTTPHPADAAWIAAPASAE